MGEKICETQKDLSTNRDGPTSNQYDVTYDMRGNEE